MKCLRVAAPFLLILMLATCATGPERIPAPANATPDASNTGPTLLIRMDVGFANDSRGTGPHTADYLSDGTVVRWINAGPACVPGMSCGTLERNTLTATGLAALLALVAKDADLLATPRAFKHALVPGLPSSRSPTIINTFVLERPDGSRYTVSAPSTSSLDAGDWAPDPAIERLGALAEVMVDPATLVGSAGLTSPAWEAYRPAKTAVFIRFSEGKPYSEGSFSGPTIADLSETGWPFAGDPDTFGAAFTPNSSEHFLEGATFRCAFLPSADAMPALASLRPIGGGTAAGYLASGAIWHSGALRWSARSPTMRFSLKAVALLPEDAAASCANALSY
jgi:hypothetical protein